MAKKKNKKKQEIKTETETSFRIKKRWSFAGLVLVIAIIVAVAFILRVEFIAPEAPAPKGFHLNEVSYSDLEGFDDDNLLNAEKAMRKSCEVIVKRPISYYATKTEWKDTCKKMLDNSFVSTTAFKNFLKNNFIPYAVTFDGENRGLFTGYYVPLLNGSRHKTEKFNVPIYAQPKDIVVVNVEEFHPKCKGCKIIGKVKNQKLVPYPKRKDIDTQELNAEVLVWLDDVVDNFILHIQGSGKVKFPDGEIRTIGFAGFNGHSFVGIGTLMIRQKLIPSGDYSMPSIRDWLQKNPKKAKELMWKNPRYIFFRTLETDPVGAQGVPLTARRSLAVDNGFISYGVPVWLDTIDGKSNPIKRLMVAQDTGGAIKGAIRGDFFWGEGDDAFDQAGRMKSKGQYYVLLPKNNDMTTKPKVEEK